MRFDCTRKVFETRWQTIQKHDRECVWGYRDLYLVQFVSRIEKFAYVFAHVAAIFHTLESELFQQCRLSGQSLRLIYSFELQPNVARCEHPFMSSNPQGLNHKMMPDFTMSSFLTYDSTILLFDSRYFFLYLLSSLSNFLIHALMPAKSRILKETPTGHLISI